MGFINKLFSRPDKAGLETKPFLVMVPLAGPVAAPDKLLRKGLIQLASPTSISECSGDAGTMTCTVLDGTQHPAVELGMCAISFMPAPIPSPDMESAYLRSWHWPEAANELRRHKHHWLIYVTASCEPEYAAAVTVRLVSALLASPEVLGIYVGSAGLVHAPEFWRANLDSEEEANAADLWVHFGMEASEDGFVSLRTQGLTQFGVMEIEIIRSSMPYEEMYGRARELACYLIHSGPVLADGHTIGRNAEEKIVIRHEASTFVPGETVHRVYV